MRNWKKGENELYSVSVCPSGFSVIYLVKLLYWMIQAIRVLLCVHGDLFSKILVWLIRVSLWNPVEIQRKRKIISRKRIAKIYAFLQIFDSICNAKNAEFSRNKKCENGLYNCASVCHSGFTVIYLVKLLYWMIQAYPCVPLVSRWSIQ